MKTSVNMMRKMGQFDVMQRTADGMFNATALSKEWNHNFPTEKRDIDNFWKTTHLDKLMAEIADNELNFKSVDFTELKNVLSKTTRGKYNGGTWMHPLLFIKFAQYLSPRFEYHVLKFVSDQLIEFRHEAGDNYNGLTSAVQRFKDINYPQLAKGLNWIVFNYHEAGIRQKATQSQLKQLVEVQKKLAFACDMGYIKTFDELINEMRRMYHMKYNSLVA